MLWYGAEEATRFSGDLCNADIANVANRLLRPCQRRVVPRGQYVGKWPNLSVLKQASSQVRAYLGEWWTDGLKICRSWVRAPPAPPCLPWRFFALARRGAAAWRASLTDRPAGGLLLGTGHGPCGPRHGQRQPAGTWDQDGMCGRRVDSSRSGMVAGEGRGAFPGPRVRKGGRPPFRARRIPSSLIAAAKVGSVGVAAYQLDAAIRIALPSLPGHSWPAQ